MPREIFSRATTKKGREERDLVRVVRRALGHRCRIAKQMEKRERERGGEEEEEEKEEEKER